MSRPLVVALLLASLMAGCTKGAATEGDDATGPSSVVSAGAEELADAGSIEGSVVDESLLPIHGAQAAVLELNLAATADEAGRFTFRNVPPGNYRVAAAALGFDSAVKTVAVSASEATTVAFTLTQIAIRGQPWLQVIGPIPGYVNCTFGTPIVAGICPGVGTVAGNEKSSFNYQMQNETTFLAGELRWAPASAGTSKLLGLTFSYNGRSSTHWWCFGSGAPPQVKWLFTMEDGTCTTTGRSQQQLPSGSPKKPNATMNLQSFVSIPFTQIGNASDPSPLHVALQQKVEVVFSLFQNYELVPPEYTAFPDG